MFKNLIEKELKEVVKEMGFLTHDIVCSISENPKFGDYTTNIALQLAKQKSQKNYQSPPEIANEILKKFGHPKYLERIEIAGPGFINFFLRDENLAAALDLSLSKKPKRLPRRILVEYASPNTHKVFHIGHLRNIITGETVSRFLQFEGNEVFRVTYTSDIGPAVAKAVWGTLKLEKEFNEARKAILREKAEFLGKAYTTGVKAYEDDPKSKEEIDSINVALYKKDPKFVPVWEETKKWSAAYFDSIYSMLGSEFDGYVWESEIEEDGKRVVEQNLGKVFLKDDGAIIFPGEKYGLHNRVFINSAGNPTYEAKEIGVTFKEEGLFPFDEAIHVVANEQSEYFKVVIKAIEQVESRMEGRKKHLSHGFVNLATGKMSSRLGNIVGAQELVDLVKEAITQTYPQNQNIGSATYTANLEKIAIGAIKFSFLKYSLGSDIKFDIKQSVSLQGDSGPYLMYAYARVRSLLKKAGNYQLQTTNYKLIIEPEEREVLRQLEYFEAFVEDASKKLQPNVLTEYLLRLAKAFNLFYEKYPILHTEREQFRLKLSIRVGEILKLGLYLLGIETVEKM